MLFTLMPSCAHKEIIGELINKVPDYKYEFDFSDPVKLKDKLSTLNLKKQEDQQKLIHILIAYNNLRVGQKENKIALTPNSKTHITINSFCAASEKAAPESKEIFRWSKGQPKIPLINEALSFYANNPKTSIQKMQELVWNLGNGTHYEEYPDSSKELVKQISPSAPLTLPSRLKSEIIDQLTPQEIKDTVSFVKGKYYSFNEFKKMVENKKSNFALPQGNFISEIPETNLSTATLSKGYETQTITFYNPTSNIQIFKTTEYFLKPYREDVQPIILASVFPYNDEIQNILEEYALKLLSYLGSQYPTLIPQEKELVKQYPIEAAIVYFNSFIAEKAGDRFFPNSGANGPSDAFRHFAWAGLLTRDLGEEKARKFLNTHELKIDQPPQEKAMDEFNNERGIQTANQFLKKGSFDNDELYEKAAEEVKSGRLRVLNHEKQDKY